LYRLAAANMTKTMDTIDTISRQPRSSSSHEVSAASIVRFVRTAAEWLKTAMEKRRGRRALHNLPDERLADIGISRAEARREAARPFWDFTEPGF
jgi:uncharacterized protein YjiS (DUF1127 family)